MGAARDGGYVAEWRQKVNRELEASADLHNKAALTLQHVTDRLDDHDRRIKTLEGSPDGLRNAFGTYGGCVGQAVFALFYIVSLGISITALVITLTR